MNLFIIIVISIILIGYFLWCYTNAQNIYYDNYEKKIDCNVNKVYLNFSDFKNYYQINKTKWITTDYGGIWYKTDGKEFLICFNSKKDLLKANRFISNLIEKNRNNFSNNNKKNLELFLNSIQEDINQAREEHYKEIEKASGVFVDTYKRLTEDSKKGIGELDAIINASKTDC